MKKKLLHNWTLKLASLILAFILWFVVIQIEKPMDTVSFSNIKVTLTNTELLDKQNKVYEILNNTDSVRVTVKAPASITEKLTAADIIAEADVSKLTEINTIAISYSVLNEDVYSVTGNRDVLRLNVEEKSNKWIKVKYETVGEVADGYLVTSVSPDQTLIEITGPVSAVEQVSYAGVQISVEGATNSISANVEAVLYNEEGEALDLPNIIKNVNYIHMQVEVMATKEVPIEVRTTGEPADGYLTAGNVECEPSSVVLAGTQAALNNVSKLVIPADMVDISGATESVVKNVSIKEYIPDNVRLVNSSYNKIKVTVPVEKQVRKTLQIPVANIAFRYVPEGLTAEYPADLLECVLNVSGLEANISPLKYYNVQGYIDVAAWMQDNDITQLEPGTYVMPVTFILSDAVTIENPVNVQVNVITTE